MTTQQLRNGQLKNEKTLKNTLFVLTVTILTAVLVTTAYNSGAKNLQTQEINRTADTVKASQVHPYIENIFYNLPLEKSRLDLLEVIIKDKRFILIDTIFNDYPANTFFKGITADKGLIKSKPDSIHVLLAYGNAALVIEKGGQEDTTKHPMFLEYKYFFSYKDSVELEYRRLLNWVDTIYTDTSSIKDDEWEAQFSKSKEKCIGKIFDHFDPYYRVAISYISVTPVDRSKPIFVLDIVFSKEDK